MVEVTKELKEVIQTKNTKIQSEARMARKVSTGNQGEWAPRNSGVTALINSEHAAHNAQIDAAKRAKKDKRAKKAARNYNFISAKGI